ncbi:hypothetical protein GCM10009720_02970 [Yaniella flava]|uniref:Protein-glutamine gamma-glutamyltransferase-like C-terminal domain-containing protein n=1 Tax=Yaniella flava TaxID=287930 RepID=A0ABN2U331_9MICC|nr:DUF4129 domain-containing protein [Micrococcaceae bacterium]
MTATPWTPNDDEARHLLDERIETYDLTPDPSGLWQAFIRWLNELLSLDVDPSGPGTIVLQVLLIVAVGVLIFLFIKFFRPSVSPDASTDESQLIDPAIPAEQYFANAERYLASGELHQAFIHAYRAMVRHAQQRQLVEVTPSTTATTFGWALSAVLASHRDAINHASSEFNRVIYGGTTPNRQDVESMMQLARSVQTARPQAAHPHDDPARLIPR